MFKTKIKILLSLVLMGTFIGSQVFAISISYPKPKKIMADAEKRYGFDKNIMRRANQKEDVPTAEIVFSNTKPQEGELVSATAYSQRFKNVAEDLYYTWYIVHTDENGDYVDSNGNPLDEEDVIEKGKVEAMGKVARGDFIPSLFGVDYNEIINNGKNADGTPYVDDEDGFFTSFGGRDGVGGRDEDDIEGIGSYETEKPNMKDEKRGIVRGDKITRCYRHNFGNVSGGTEDLDAGKDLIVSCKHKFPNPDYLDDYVKYTEEGDKNELYKVACGEDGYSDEIGNDDFNEIDEACWMLNPNSADTDGDGFVDEADLAGLGQQTFTWRYKEGDRVGVIIEGTSMIAINEDGSIPDEVSEQEKQIEEILGIEDDGIVTEIEYPSDDLDDSDGYQPDTETVVDTAYVGGGWVNAAQFAAAAKEIMNREFDMSSWNLDSQIESQAIEDLLEALDAAGVSKTGGIIDASELRQALDDGMTIEDLQSDFSDPFADVSDYEGGGYFFVGDAFSGAALFSTLQDYFRLDAIEARACILQQSTGVQQDIAENLSGKYNDGTYDWETMTDSEIRTALEDYVFYMNACGGPNAYGTRSLLFEYWAGTNKNDPNEYYELINEDLQREFLTPLGPGDPGYDPMDPNTQYAHSLESLTQCFYTYFEDGKNIKQEGSNDTNTTSVSLSDGLTVDNDDFFTEEIPIGELEDELAEIDAKHGANSYYKIMWAGLGVCSTENDDYMEGDECMPEKDADDDDSNDIDSIIDNADDDDLFDFDMDRYPEDDADRDPTEYGFTYLETRPVFLDENELLETVLDYAPKNPSYNEINPNYSDNITIVSQLKNGDVDKKFIYYDWEIYKCDSLNDEDCTEYDNNWITKECSLGSSLEYCTKETDVDVGSDNVDVNIFKSESIVSGMGVDSISFTPYGYYVDDDGNEVNLLTDDTEEKMFFKVVLKTKELNSDNSMALSSTMIQVNKKNISIDFYKTVKEGDSYLLGQKICTDEISTILCPVYPFQILAAKISKDSSETVNGYSWEFDGVRQNSPQNCEGDACNQDDDEALIYFPIHKSFEGIYEVKLNVQLEKTIDQNVITKNLTLTRNVGVKNPLAYIESDSSEAWTWADRVSADDYDGSYINLFYANPNSRVEFRADLVPYYLDLDQDDVSLIWFINGKEVDDYFISENPELDVFLDEEKISFRTPVDFRNINLGVKVLKSLSNKEDLYSAWKVNALKDELEDFSSISIKRYIPSSVEGDESIGSIGLFFASTIRNVPEYLLFSLKLSVIIILTWSALFGSVLFFKNQEVKLINKKK